MSTPSGRVISSISARFRRKSRAPLKPTGEVNTHKLVEKFARVSGRVFTLIIVFVQGVLMCFYLARQRWPPPDSKDASSLHPGSNFNSSTHYSDFLSHKCPTDSHSGPLDKDWFLLLFLDLFTILLFARCLWKSYDTISKIKTQRKSEVDLPRLSVIALAASNAKKRTSKGFVYSMVDNLTSLPVAYTFYIATIILRVCIILGREFQHNSFKCYHDYEAVLAIVASTAICFMLLVLSHHNAFPSSDRRSWMEHTAGHVTLNVLDCSEFLESIFMEHVKEESDKTSFKSLIYAVISFSCISLIVPVISLIELSQSHYGMNNMNDKIQLAYLLCSFVFVDGSFLIMRFLILLRGTNEVLIMFVKNIILVLLLLREIYHTSLRIKKNKSKEKRGRTSSVPPALLERRTSVDLTGYINESVARGETPVIVTAEFPFEAQF